MGTRYHTPAPQLHNSTASTTLPCTNQSPKSYHVTSLPKLDVYLLPGPLDTSQSQTTMMHSQTPQSELRNCKEPAHLQCSYCGAITMEDLWETSVDGQWRQCPKCGAQIAAGTI
ncbi:hypothetical protein PMIN06_004026 [Paraphaeosphaeria minitans]